MDIALDTRIDQNSVYILAMALAIVGVLIILVARIAR